MKAHANAYETTDLYDVAYLMMLMFNQNDIEMYITNISY